LFGLEISFEITSFAVDKTLAVFRISASRARNSVLLDFQFGGILLIAFLVCPRHTDEINN
jgi:hypothetical protein